LFFNKKSHFRSDDQESIINACLKGDQLAQKALIGIYFSFAKSISMRYVENKQEVDEIINDSFLKIFNNLAKYDHSQPFKAWIRKIIVNTAIDHFRKNQQFNYNNQSDIEDIGDVEVDENIISKISSDEILSLINKLSPSYRIAFNLFVIEGYTHREIADMLGISEGTSKSNLMDARKKLQGMISSAYPYHYHTYQFKLSKVHEN
jgi:RNA polymerase sigma-70 factor (ECF subfamily)